MEKGHPIGQKEVSIKTKTKEQVGSISDFVLEKSIFNNVFEKDIRSIFIYKKVERLAKALQLIIPAFSETPSFQDRIDAVTIGLVDASILPATSARGKLSRELLALSSLLSVARVRGILSSMNAELIAREAHILLEEIAEYEEPRVALEETPTLSEIARQSVVRKPVTKTGSIKSAQRKSNSGSNNATNPKVSKGQIKDTGVIKDRRDAILAVIKDKKVVSIKDISTLIRNISEKTIQRELTALVAEGIVLKEGERRWSTYSFAG